MKPRRKYAPFNSIEQYTPSTRTSMEQSARTYELAAEAAGHDASEPPQAWFDEFIIETATRLTTTRARRILRGVWYYFARQKLMCPVSLDMVNDRLFAMDHPLHEWPIRRHKGPRAQRYLDNALSPESIQAYQRYLRYWLEFAASRDLDPRQQNEEAVIDWLGVLADFLESSSIKIALNALSRYWVAAGTPDATRTTDVARTVEGIERTIKPVELRPYEPGDIARMTACLGPYDLDARDGFLVLLVFFGGLTFREISCLDRACARIEDDFLILDPLPDGSVLRIGGCDDPLLDIRYWARRWFCAIGDGPGPLMPKTVTRGGFSQVPIHLGTMTIAIRDLAVRAGVPSPYFGHAARRSFRELSVRIVGPVQTAHHARIKFSTLAEQIPMPSSKAEAAKRRQRFGRKRAQFKLPPEALTHLGASGPLSLSPGDNHE